MELNLAHEVEQSIIFARNSEVTKLFEMFILPKTKKELEAILSNFWNKYEEFMPASEDSSEFDASCMYVLDYVYKHKDVSLSSIPRSIYAYLKQSNLSNSENNGNELFELGDGCFWTAALHIKRFDSLEGEIILKAMFNNILSGNFGLLNFMLKFGIEQFLFKDSGAGEKILELLAHWFHGIHASGHIGEEEADRRTIQIDDLINRIKESDINFRRSTLIFCNICNIADYRAWEVIEREGHEQFFVSARNYLCKSTLECVDIIIDATTETKITIKDIDNFLAFLKPLLGENVVRLLVETSRKLYSEEVREHYQPRSLKDLARCEIRSSLRISSTMPGQVHQLPLPSALKPFLLFDSEDIWEELKSFQEFVYVSRKLKRLGN